MSEQFRNQLKQWSKINNFPQQERHTKKKKEENLTKYEIEELMGTRMPTYRRGRGGAYKQKG